jgi:Asp-tRNA(Asn)/Glu-tRNA(Gln) amidotransferase A subunit family amidase
MATNLMDIARLLSVIAGYDGLDPRMIPESPLRQSVKDYASELSTFIGRESTSGENLGTGMRIGLLRESFLVPGMSEAVKSTVHAVATNFLSASGATVREMSVPLHLLGPAIWTAATRGSTARPPISPDAALAASMASRSRSVRSIHPNQSCSRPPSLLGHLRKGEVRRSCGGEKRTDTSSSYELYMTKR